MRKKWKRLAAEMENSSFPHNWDVSKTDVYGRIQIPIPISFCAPQFPSLPNSFPWDTYPTLLSTLTCLCPFFPYLLSPLSVSSSTLLVNVFMPYPPLHTKRPPRFDRIAKPPSSKILFEPHTFSNTSEYWWFKGRLSECLRGISDDPIINNKTCKIIL